MMPRPVSLHAWLKMQQGTGLWVESLGNTRSKSEVITNILRLTNPHENDTLCHVAL